MHFEGTFVRSVDADGNILLPDGWVPDDRMLCAFVPPRAIPPRVAVYRAEMEAQLKENLPLAAKVTGLAMEVFFLSISGGQVRIPEDVLTAIAIQRQAKLVGMGLWFFIMNNENYPNVQFLMDMQKS